MKILALEFSTNRRSVAVAVDAVSRAEAAEEGTRETHAFGLIEDALRQSHVAREEIECIAIGIGPGSYAGIRIAIAIAQGWQLACDVKLLGISSADAVAGQAYARGWRGLLHTIVDAQRNEFYEAIYQLNDDEWQLREPFRLVGPERVPGDLFVRCDIVSHQTDKCLFPEANMIARLAVSRFNYVTGSELQPIYLRKAEFVKAPPPRIS